MASRTQARKHLADVLRVERLEEDADEFEKDLTLVLKRLDRMNGLLVGILISLATGAVLLALNLAATGT